ncbi:MAG: hypothetical protein WBB82_15705 [Limnothrix sp.]
MSQVIYRAIACHTFTVKVGSYTLLIFKLFSPTPTGFGLYLL